MWTYIMEIPKKEIEEKIRYVHGKIESDKS